MPYVEILPNSYNAGLLEEQEIVACKKYKVVFSPYLLLRYFILPLEWHSHISTLSLQ